MAKCGACTTIPRMRHRFVVKQLAGTADAAGHVDESDASNWETYARLSAAIVAKSSREFWGADQAQADVTHQLTFRWGRTYDAISPAMRLTSGDKTYNLSGPPFDPDGNRRILKLNAIEVR